MNFIKRIVKSLFFVVGFKISKNYNSVDTVNLSLDNHNLDQSSLIEKYKWLNKYNVQGILDIGANDGHFASIANAVFSHSPIVCFEPLKVPFENLVKSLSRYSNFKFYNFALGQTEQSMPMNHNEYSPSSSLLEMQDLHKENFDFTKNVVKEVVQIKRLDDVFPILNISENLLIKIDVQGFEMEVLKGGMKTLKFANIIIVETTFQSLYKNQPLFDEVYELLIKEGFSFSGNVEQLLSPIDNSILQADSVFIRRSK